MGAKILSSTGLQSGTLIGRAQFIPVPALDKSHSPRKKNTNCMPNIFGRLWCRTMDMNGGSSASYLACTLRFPLFCTLLNRGGARRAFRLPGEGRIISIVRWNLRPVLFSVDKPKRTSSVGVGVFHVKGWGPKSSVCPSNPRKTKFFGGNRFRASGPKIAKNNGQ